MPKSQKQKPKYVSVELTEDEAFEVITQLVLKQNLGAFKKLANEWSAK